ncbi:Golgin-84 [Porphyridium purpureum]|uniref:Golgin-84 n=1 Tax=Porphyridium purpureum TaxID=35688 RepID=A0A5J4Z014_PORPP|nr:Golgin-84 [Porphyridium purpureum]|eukprot:POR8868..scf208_2
MAFFRNALKRAETFLETVDESVAQASRRLALDSSAFEVEEEFEDEEQRESEASAQGHAQLGMASAFDDADENVKAHLENTFSSARRGEEGGLFETQHTDQQPTPADSSASARDASSVPSSASSVKYQPKRSTRIPKAVRTAPQKTTTRGNSRKSSHALADSDTAPASTHGDDAEDQVGSSAAAGAESAAQNEGADMTSSSQTKNIHSVDEHTAAGDVVQTSLIDSPRLQKRSSSLSSSEAQIGTRSQTAQERENDQSHARAESGEDHVESEKQVIDDLDGETAFPRPREDAFPDGTSAEADPDRGESATSEAFWLEKQNEAVVEGADSPPDINEFDGHHQRALDSAREAYPDEEVEEEDQGDGDEESELGDDPVQMQFVEDLQRENMALRTELDSSESYLRKLRDEKHMLAKNLKSAKGIIEELELDRKSLMQDIRDLRDAVESEQNGASSVKSELMKEAEALRAQLKKVEREKDQTEQSMHAMTSELNSKVSFLESEKARLSQLLIDERARDLTDADDARRQANEARAALEAEMASHAATRHRTTVREEQLEMELVNAGDALAKAETRIEDERKLTLEAQQRLMVLESESLRLKRELRELSASNKNMDGVRLRHDEANRLLEENFETISKFEETAAALEKTLEEREQTIEELQQKVHDLEALRQQESSRRLAHRADPEGRDQVVEEMMAQLRRMTDSALRKQSQLELLRGENRALQHQLEQERQRSRNAQAMAASATRALNVSGTSVDLERGVAGPMGSAARNRATARPVDADPTIPRYKPPLHMPRWLASALRVVDRFSLQLMQVFRNEPSVRIVLILYFLALHLFVYIVLHVSNVASASTGSHSVFNPGA